jgi:hypothetical protein
MINFDGNDAKNTIQSYASVVAIVSFILYAIAEFTRPSWRKPPFYVFSIAACTLLFVATGVMLPYVKGGEITPSAEAIYIASRSIVLVLALIGAQAALKHIRPRG